MGEGLAIAALAGFLLLAPMQRAAADDMMTVGQLLQDCHTNSTVCAQDFGSSAINMAFLWGGNCIPAKLTRQQTDMAVLRWLSAHQDIAQEDAPDGIADAVGALWPCGSP
jgi:Ssp1 endopeptidase immunity protein Rap1a